ncbi:DUF192 domain-containing protein [Haladaptatus cibarius]|uniref:DUF192 domain-containing protein n=1 Tax=Haladaptatus cibarius TaxID=453847 RepID=UPI0006792812|nr:DUF192 domain-containing protein [Haladaptatus cibarius]
MHVIRRRDGVERTLSSRTDRMDSLGSRMRGLFRLFRREDCALVFEFDSVAERRASTLFTPLALDVVWTENGQVTRVARLNPWTGFARGRGDSVVEFPAGVADVVRPDDELVVR